MIGEPPAPTASKVGPCPTSTLIQIVDALPTRQPLDEFYTCLYRFKFIINKTKTKNTVQSDIFGFCPSLLTEPIKSSRITLLSVSILSMLISLATMCVVQIAFQQF